MYLYSFLHPGRLDVQVEIGLPDKDGQFDILSPHGSHEQDEHA